MVETCRLALAVVACSVILASCVPDATPIETSPEEPATQQGTQLGLVQTKSQGLDQMQPYPIEHRRELSFPACRRAEPRLLRTRRREASRLLGAWASTARIVVASWTTRANIGSPLNVGTCGRMRWQ